MITLLDGHATVLPKASSIHVISDVGLHKYAFGFFATSIHTLIACGPIGT